MVKSLPPNETVYAMYGSDLYKEFVVRDYPDPNQDGSPGTLKTLTGSTFVADLRTAYDEQILMDDGVFDLGDYLSVAGAGKVALSIPRATLEELPIGTHRYRVAYKLGSDPLTPLRIGAFVIYGPSQNGAYISSSSEYPSGIDGGAP